jgi:superfamily I DNA/RNA helicase
MELSTYQKTIIDYFDTHPHDNMIVKALAGTGKSTLLKLLTDRSTTSDIYVAFNNTIAEEFRGKITNPKTKVSTLHSLALSIMNYNLKEKGGKSVGIGSRRGGVSAGAKLDNLKIHKIIDDIIEETGGRSLDFEKRLFYKDNYVTLYNLCRLTRTDMSDDEAVQRLIKDYCLFIDYSGNDYRPPSINTIIAWLENIDKKSKKEFDSFNVIDFTDMLYITYLKVKKGEWEIPYWAYYTNILVDEAQDLCNLQINFLKFIKRRGGRYVFVMDENQAIYSFSGANANSCNLIPKLYAPIKEFSLPINYRCPTSHLKRVNNNFNIPILPRPDAPVGKITTIEKKDIVKHTQVGDMIISRKNKWLTEVVLDLAKNGISVYMQDKEAVEQIKNTISRQKAESLYQLKNKLNKIVEQYNKTLEKICANKGQANESSDTDKMVEITATNSKIDNICFVLEILKNYSSNPKNKYNTVKEFQSYIDQLLNTTSPKDCVRLCSVHKAKGLEAPNVFVLNEAKVCKDPRNSWEQNEQEKNLSYISITRAMNNLYLVREQDA